MISGQSCNISIRFLNESIVEKKPQCFQVFSRTLALVNVHFISALNSCYHVYVNIKKPRSQFTVRNGRERRRKDTVTLFI